LLFVNLVIVEENIDVFRLDTEKVQYVTGPVHLVLHNLLEEVLD